MTKQTSSIGWIDFSSLARERVSQVLAMLQEKGTLDELGIGQIRDAFSDQLFPGISTIQTRAKYFVTVPYIFHDYRQLEIHNRPALAEYIGQQEDELAKRLVEKHKENMPYGIIGKDSLEKGVARKPSSVYWNGLRQLSIVTNKLSLREFITQYQDLANHPKKNNDEDDNEYSNIAELMRKPDGYSPSWLENVSIDLTQQEAEFLRDKFLSSTRIKDSVPAQLIKHKLINHVLKIKDDSTRNPWQAKALYESLKDKPISSQTMTCFKKALEFSFVLEGAHIRYNILIAQRANNIKHFDYLKKEFKDWYEQARKQLNSFEKSSINSWYSVAFENARLPNDRTRQFIKQWCLLIRQEASSEELDACVKKRAIANKGNRCLLKKALSEDQNWVGMRKLDFRWPSARIILQDIQEGLNANAR